MAPPPAVDVAATYDLTIMQGSDFLKTFTLTDGTTPYDLTGVTVEAKIRAEFGGTLIATFTSSVPLPATDGVVQIELDSATTTALTGDGGTNRNNSERWVWDLELTYTGGEIYRWLQGEVTLSQEATTA